MSAIVASRSILNSITRIKCPVRSVVSFKTPSVAMPTTEGYVKTTPFTKGFFFRQLFDTDTSTYTYLLADLRTKDAVIIDPVLEHAKRDAQLITELGFKLKYAMNTHMHADHITGTGYLKRLLPGTLSAIAKASGANADRHLDDKDVVVFGGHKIEGISTPGHTDGCMSFVMYDQGVVFTGDALLIRGCGRTDFQEGSAESLYHSIHDRIFKLPDNFLVYPAHDYKGQMASTIYEEKHFNPRLAQDKDTFIRIMNDLNLSKPRYIDKAIPANRECGLYDIPSEP